MTVHLAGSRPPGSSKPESESAAQKRGFVQTLPGVLTAAGSFLGALAGLIAVLIPFGTFRDEQAGAQDVVAAASPLQVISASVSTDPPMSSGGCPAVVTLPAELELNGSPGVLSYRWDWDDRQDSAPVFIEIATGERHRVIQIEQRLGQPIGLRERLVDDAVSLHILSPNQIASPKAEVRVDCR